MQRIEDWGKGAFFLQGEPQPLHDCVKKGCDMRAVKSETAAISDCGCMYCLPTETHVERTSEEIRRLITVTTTSGLERACSDERKLATHLMIPLLVIQRGVMLPLSYPGSSHLVRCGVIRSKHSDERQPIVPVSSLALRGLKRPLEIIKSCLQFGKSENNRLSSVRVVRMVLIFRKQAYEKTVRKHCET